MKRSLCLIICLIMALSLMGCYKEVKPSSDTNVYIDSQIEKNGEVILPVFDAVINNPKYPTTITVTTLINNETKFLFLAIGENRAYITLEDCTYYVDETNPFTYITDETKNENYNQYIVIKRDGIIENELNTYYKYKCSLYIHDANFGDNDNGKYAPINSMKIGE